MIRREIRKSSSSGNKGDDVGDIDDDVGDVGGVIYGCGS